jgi:hypothetical protein
MITKTMKQKVDLFKQLYTELAGQGINGDTELAHVNKYEAVVLKAMGGSGTVNTVTGLRQFDWLSGGSDPAPAPSPATSTTVKQVSDLPEYFKPYVEELFATAQDVYEKPYVPYGSELVQDAEGKSTIQKLEDIVDPVTGAVTPADKRLADVTEEQAIAFGGLRDLFTQLDPESGQRVFRDPTSEGFTEAQRLSERGARGFDELAQIDPATGEVIKSAADVFSETYMSPYKQAVTDIQVKEAQKIQEQKRQQRQGAARMANALGGSRYGVQEALAGGIDAQLLDDIQRKGLQEAYTQGLSTFDADRLAATRGATQRTALAQDQLSQGLKGLGALQTTGEAQRAIAQQPLDLSYEEFARQQQFPRQNLQELSGILRGFNVPPSTYKTTQAYTPPMTLGQQLMAAGTLGAGISSGLGKSLLKSGGGSIGLANGGATKTRADMSKTSKTSDDSLVGLLKKIKRDKAKWYANIAEDVEEKDQGKIMDEYILPPPTLIEEKIVIPDEAQDVMYSTPTEVPLPSDKSSGIKDVLGSFVEGWEAFAPYGASYAKQKGWTDTAEGLEELVSGISTRDKQAAETEYYRNLGTKAKAWEAIEQAKAGRILTKNRTDALMKGLTEELEIIKAKITAGFGDEEVLQHEVDRIINTMRELALVSYARKGVGRTPDVKPAD